jgi:hypothetical protein
VTALYVCFHRWRGFALTNVEPDLFHVVFKLGFCTLYVCKRCLVDAYRKLRCTVVDAVSKSDRANQ